MLRERLEEMGILKHHPTAEEAKLAEARIKALNEDYSRGDIELQELKSEFDKIPGLDLVRIVNKPGFTV
jgi:hypothetical protein